MSLVALEAAISLFGTQDAFAAALGIKSPSISEWRKRGKVPVARCADIERITSRKVTRQQLREDVFDQREAA